MLAWILFPLVKFADYEVSCLWYMEKHVVVWRIHTRICQPLSIAELPGEYTEGAGSACDAR